jgi:hypothetical protein
MQNGVQLYRKLASREDFTSYSRVVDTVTNLGMTEDEEEDYALKNQLAGLYKSIQKNPGDGDATIFAPYFKQFNDIALKCFQTYTGVLGTTTTDYEAALEMYRNDVIKVLQEGFARQALRAPDDKVWLDTVLARVYLWLSPYGSEFMHLPLMTGAVMDMVWKELEASKEGYVEVSTMTFVNVKDALTVRCQAARWFEALLDTMKIHAGHSHAVDDKTEALMCAIEKERGMNSAGAVTDVSDSTNIYATLT